jgi:predicted tellurium resistance membrane protein TerC
MSDWTFNGVARMLELISSQHLTALFQVVMIDLVLAGDNAIVIGLAAAGLPEGQRKKAILIGIVAATILRIGFASVTVQLLQIIGLLLAGGVLLLWVCWKMWRELRTSHHQPTFRVCRPQARWMRQLRRPAKRRLVRPSGRSRSLTSRCRSTTCSPSQGAAREHPMILIFGLALSIALMGFAANFIARLLEKHRWIAYVGLAIILYVALDMCYRGVLEVWPHLNA